MSALLILAATVVVLTAALNASQRRHAGALPELTSGPSTSAALEDRDLARLRDELRAAQSADPTTARAANPAGAPSGAPGGNRVAGPAALPVGTVGDTPTPARRTTAPACPPHAA